ncbi:ABC transporter substrate-binding protein [Geobacter pelophilus]|uniref:ABC transporter substrate-binding protein n=1 Tax=Geoanaerobacter pelophilus TaxID=60036 RepID=A0AAW4L647_9BACT|nr:ABC transporter substrate-binding protein [Geoanaerobacter pelophilus]MBT0664045.1 ABC transporter substrate-binding protein [Geoanaerobacter pelophilus]
MKRHAPASPRRDRYFIRLMAVAMALAMGACCCACSRTDRTPAGPTEKITLAYGVQPESALAQVAEARGYYRQEGLGTTIHLHPYGKRALADLLAGKADFATVAEPPVMFAIMNGEKIAVIATIYTSTLGHAILARKDRGISSFRDLAGKKIAATLGTTAHFFVDTILVTHGIARKDVEVVDLKAEEIPDALVRGDIDAVATFSPYLELTHKKLGDRVIIFSDRDVYRYTYNVVATQDFIRKNPAKVRKMLRALVRAEEFAREHPEAAQKIVANFSGIEFATLRDTWPNARFTVSLDQSLLLALEDESRWAVNSGLIPQRDIPNYLDFIYFDGLRSVKPEAVRILR